VSLTPRGQLGLGRLFDAQARSASQAR
jgi:hypothetical protein